ADEEDLHTGVPAFLMQRDDVGFFDRLGVDALGRLYSGQSADAVAQRRGAFKFHRRTRLGHGGGQFGLYPCRAPAEEQNRIIDQPAVVVLPDQPHAGGAATLDLMQEARACASLEDAVGAAAQQEGLLQLVERAVDAARRGEGAEVAPSLLAQAAVLL